MSRESDGDYSSTHVSRITNRHGGAPAQGPIQILLSCIACTHGLVYAPLSFESTSTVLSTGVELNYKKKKKKKKNRKIGRKKD